MNYYKLIPLSLLILSLFSCKKATALQVPSLFVVGQPLKESVADRKASDRQTGKTVWICQSAAAKRYHYNASCRGLKRCTHTVLKTTVERAKAVGLTACGFEK